MTYTMRYINEYGAEIDFSWASGYVLAETTGLTSNVIDTVNSQGISQVGKTLRGQSVQPRIITCKGTALGESRMRRQQLINTILPNTRAQLIFDDIWHIDVVPKMTPNISRHNDNCTFDFILEAAYPYWHKEDDDVTALSEMIPMFKFPWNLTKPWKFGERSAAQLSNVINNGNVPTEFTVIFTAITTVQNPSITKASTLEFIRVNRTMSPGESITVRNSANRVEVLSTIAGVTVDIFSYLDFNSTLFLLDVGDNVLRYDADYNRDGLDIRIIRPIVSVGAYME